MLATNSILSHSDLTTYSNRSDGSDGNFLDGLSASDLTSASSITSTVGTALNAVIPGAGLAINLLESIDFLGAFSGLNAIFANGFDPSCFGSTLNTQYISESIQENHTPHFQGLFEKVQQANNVSELGKSVTDLSIFANTMVTGFTNKQSGTNWRSCSKKALQHGVQIGETFRTKVLDLVEALKNDYNVQSVDKVLSVPQQYKWTTNGWLMTIDQQWGSIHYKEYSFTSKAVNVPNVDSSNNNNVGDVNNGGYEAKKTNYTGLIVGAVISKIFKLW